MRTVVCLVLLILGLSPANAQSICERLSGAGIVAQDGTFLGLIANSFESRSVLNEFGDFGSEFSSTSIWNEFGEYGGKFSSHSPFNPHTSTPPIILMNGQPIGFLSVQDGQNTLNPYALKMCE